METLWWAAVTAVNLATPLAIVLCTRSQPAVRIACAGAALATTAAAWTLMAGPAYSMRFTSVFGSAREALAFVFAPWLATVFAAAMVVAVPGCAVRVPAPTTPRALEGRAAGIAQVSLAVVALLGAVYAFWSDLDEAACWIALITLQSSGLVWLVAGRRAASSPAA